MVFILGSVCVRARHWSTWCENTDNDGSESFASFASAESEDEEPNHHLLPTTNGDAAFLKEKPVRLARELLWNSVSLSLSLSGFSVVCTNVWWVQVYQWTYIHKIISIFICMYAGKMLIPGIVCSLCYFETYVMLHISNFACCCSMIHICKTFISANCYNFFNLHCKLP